MLHAAILQRANHLEAGAVADVAEALERVAAESALQNVAVFGAIEKRAPLLEFAHAVRRLPARGAGPCASCSGIFRRAWCRGNAFASCRRDRRWPWPRRCRLRPSPCALCRAAICKPRRHWRLARALRRAARKPAPPAPMISTSCSCVSYLEAAAEVTASNVLQVRRRKRGGYKGRSGRRKTGSSRPTACGVHSRGVTQRQAEWRGRPKAEQEKQSSLPPIKMAQGMAGKCVGGERAER